MGIDRRIDAAWRIRLAVTGRALLAVSVASMLLMTIGSTPAAAAPAPIAAYGFDEGTGTSATDDTGNGHTGTISVPDLWAAGHSGSAVYNDSTAGGVAADGITMSRVGLEPANEISVMAWVYLSDWTTSPWSPAVTKGLDLIGDSATLYGLAGMNRPGFNITTANNTNATAYGPQNLSAGWHHLAGTYDGSDVRVYVDGVLEDTTPATGALQYDSSDWSMLRSYVWSEYLEGGVDDARIFDVAVSDADVTALMAIPVGITDTASSTVGAIVDPSLSFTIAGYNAGACNGAVVNATGSTGTAVTLRPTTIANAIGGQTLTVSSNAASGYSVFARYSGTLSDGNGHNVADWTGTNASPTTFSGAGTAAFGYTTDHNLSGTATRFQTDKWAQFLTSNEEVAYKATGPTATDVTHVCMQVGLSGSVPAGLYTTTVTYTAVPIF